MFALGDDSQEARGGDEVSAADFAELSPMTLADCLPRSQIMEFAVRPLWPSPRIAGPAYTVRCCAGDKRRVYALRF